VLLYLDVPASFPWDMVLSVLLAMAAFFLQQEWIFLSAFRDHKAKTCVFSSLHHNFYEHHSAI